MNCDEGRARVAEADTNSSSHTDLNLLDRDGYYAAIWLNDIDVEAARELAYEKCGFSWSDVEVEEKLLLEEQTKSGCSMQSEYDQRMTELHEISNSLVSA